MLKKRLLLGFGVLLSISLIGCSKDNSLHSTNTVETEITESQVDEEVSEDTKEDTNDVSSNLDFAKENYVEGEKPLYINNILVVNKQFGLPENFASKLDEETLKAFETMKADAKEDGIVLNIRSGFRTRATQEMLFNNYAKRDGIENANRYSAKPGFSEHESGLAIDITTEDTVTSIGDWFTNTQQAKWLYENAYKYGFILRYPEGKEHITGYKYESWHYRYVGLEHSKNFAMNNLTLEEYLKIVETE